MTGFAIWVTNNTACSYQGCKLEHEIMITLPQDSLDWPVAALSAACSIISIAITYEYFSQGNMCGMWLFYPSWAVQEKRCMQASIWNFIYAPGTDYSYNSVRMSHQGLARAANMIPWEKGSRNQMHEGMAILFGWTVTCRHRVSSSIIPRPSMHLQVFWLRERKGGRVINCLRVSEATTETISQ